MSRTNETSGQRMNRGEREEDRSEEAGAGDPSSASWESTSAAASVPRHWTQLIPMRTQKDTRRFLRAILPKFRRKVDMEKSFLLDALMGAKIITDRDAESLVGSHLPTDREKNRRLWSILFNISHITFVNKALPILCEYYSYIIPDRFWLPGDAAVNLDVVGPDMGAGESPCCARCAITARVPCTEIGQYLMWTGLISERTYSDICDSYRKANTNWPKIFEAFKRLAGRDISNHVTAMRKLMAEYSLMVPEDLPQLMIQGFPCRCSSNKKCGLCIPSCLGANFSSDSSLSSAQSALVNSVSDDSLHANSGFGTSASIHNTDTASIDNSHSSAYSETLLKQVASASEQNASFSTDANTESNNEAAQYSCEKVKETEREFVGEDEPPAYSRYSENEGQVNVLFDYTEITGTSNNMAMLMESSMCIPDGSDELPAQEAQKMQFYGAMQRKEDRVTDWDYQTLNSEIRHSADSMSQKVCSYFAYSAGPRENGGFKDLIEDGSASLVHEKTDLCHRDLLWINHAMLDSKTDSSSVVDNLANVVGIPVLCGLVLAPFLLLFIGVYSQNYAFHAGGTALLIFLLFLTVVLRNAHR